MVLPGPQGPFHIHSEINRVGGWAKFNSNGRGTYPALCCAVAQSRFSVLRGLPFLVVHQHLNSTEANCEGDSATNLSFINREQVS